MDVLLTYFQTQLQRVLGERGQGALEYIAIVIGLIIIAVAVFAAFGEGILIKAEEFLESIGLGNLL